MDNKEIRRLNFRYLADKRYGRANIAKMLGYDDNNYINQAIKGHALMGDKIARRIEVACSLPHGWMDLPYLQGWENADVDRFYDDLMADLPTAYVDRMIERGRQTLELRTKK